jgi:hypothetical protein
MRVFAFHIVYLLEYIELVILYTLELVCIPSYFMCLHDLVLSSCAYYSSAHLRICESYKYGTYSSVMTCTGWYARSQLSAP